LYFEHLYLYQIYLLRSYEIHTIDSLDAHTVTDNTSIDCSSEKVILFIHFKYYIVIPPLTHTFFEHALVSEITFGRTKVLS